MGSTVAITLAADGTTSGQLFIPGGAEDRSDVDVDLVGTWALSGATVTLNQTGDTFIRDSEFAAARNRLTGEGSFSGTLSARLGAHAAWYRPVDRRSVAARDGTTTESS